MKTLKEDLSKTSSTPPNLQTLTYVSIDELVHHVIY